MAEGRRIIYDDEDKEIYDKLRASSGIFNGMNLIDLFAVALIYGKKEGKRTQLGKGATGRVRESTIRNSSVKELMMVIAVEETGDMDILSDALTVLQKEILWSPVAFQLLPKKFTVRQLQNLLEAVFGVEIDNRNFRKKLFTSGILAETGEIEQNVSHKPAKLYTLNKSAFGKKKLDIVKIFTI